MTCISKENIKEHENNFILISCKDIDNFIFNGYYVINNIYNYDEIINICLETYNKNNKYNYNSKEKTQGIDKKFNQENEDFFILQINTNSSNTIYLDNIINIFNFAKLKIFGKQYYLNINEEYVKILTEFLNKQSYKEYFNQQFSEENNLKLQNDIFYYYLGKNKNKYLFRECTFEEIRDLLIYGKIIPRENDYHKYFYFTYYTNDAIRRISNSFNYMVIYDKEKLINQGIHLTSEKYSKWNTRQEIQYKNQSTNGNKRIEFNNNKEKFHNAIINNPNKKIKNITFNDVGISFEHEAIGKQITLESGLIHDILMSPKLKNQRYYEQYLIIIKLFQNLINNK
jgi:hypothetical protein